MIKYHRGIRLFAWILCVLGWPVLLLGLLGLIGLFIKPEAANLVGTALFLLWGGVFGLMGVWLLGPRYRFDAGVGQLAIRHCWRTRRQPLAEIVAVQVIDAGRFESGYVSGGPRAIFSSNQLNLILNDPKRPRLFVAYNEDLTDMARKAKVLADFLHVPLLAVPKVQAIVQSYGRHDSAQPAGEAGAGRFSGRDTLPRLRDRRLPEPYRLWIDRARPLPAQVHLLPRSVNVVFDLGMFLMLGVMFIGMSVLIAAFFWSNVAKDLARGAWRSSLIVSAIALLLGMVPLFLLRRVFITVGAWLDQKRGTLRQGIFVGPGGVLVRMEPNRCYPIALDRFVNAKKTESGDSRGMTLFVIETLDGTVDFFSERLTVSPEHLNRCVEALRKSVG